MERNVVTLDTADKLNTAGFPQPLPSEYAWALTPSARGLNWELYRNFKPADPRVMWYAAPTAQEIADELPICIEASQHNGWRNRYLVVSRTTKGWTARYESDGARRKKPAPTAAEALGLLWLRLQAKS
jgi:hypothetical protein